MTYLLDTCALLWWTLDPSKITPRANVALLDAEKIGAQISTEQIWLTNLPLK